jgi:hypothetical protein
MSNLLRETISNTFKYKLEEYGIDVLNNKNKKTFKAIFSMADLSAEFTLSDQEWEEEIQGVCFNDDAPKTGDVLTIEGKKYITQTVQSRINSPITRFYAKLKI